MQANREELQILFSDFNPEVVSLQETQMKPNSNVSFKNYCIYHRPGTEKNGTFYGGAAILIKNSIAHKDINITSSLQAIAVRATLFKSITICSLYLPPSSKWTKSDIDDIIAQLPPPILLLGDFNAHSKDWGCPSNDRKGKIIGDLLTERDLSILNDGSTTYLHPGSGCK